jgi:hypothetical protein
MRAAVLLAIATLALAACSGNSTPAGSSPTGHPAPAQKTQ